MTHDPQGIRRPADARGPQGAHGSPALRRATPPQALRVAGLLDKDQQALAKAVVAVIKQPEGRQAARRRSRGDAASDARWRPMPASRSFAAPTRSRKRRKLLAFRAARSEGSRRSGCVVGRAAADLARAASTRATRRPPTRSPPSTRPRSSPRCAEAEFHAGWYALEFLHDPATAAKHFAAIQAVSTMPLSQSRAEYWLGRAAARRRRQGRGSRAFQARRRLSDDLLRPARARPARRQAPGDHAPPPAPTPPPRRASTGANSSRHQAPRRPSTATTASTSSIATSPRR